MSGERQEAQVPIRKEGTEGRKQMRAPQWALRKTEEPLEQAASGRPRPVVRDFKLGYRVWQASNSPQ